MFYIGLVIIVLLVMIYRTLYSVNHKLRQIRDNMLEKTNLNHDQIAINEPGHKL
jgi:cell division protein FtsL